VFLERPEAPERQVFGEADLEDARGRIESLLEQLAAGHFEVTDRPHKALCADCPARERLCSHRTGAQMRDDPDPPISPSEEDDEERRDEPQLSLLEGE
jgi:hypothetical protein